METLLVRFSGAIEETLDKLVKEGYFVTKSEAVRAGILQLGKEYLTINKAREHRIELEKAFSKRKYNPEEVAKKIRDLEA